MLYKIEFLTIEKMKVKRDYEIFNCSSWQDAVNRFVEHEKYYLPIWILDINRWGRYAGDEMWLPVRDGCNIDQLNIDLGFSSVYNESGL